MFQSRRMKHIEALRVDRPSAYIKTSVLKKFSTEVNRTVIVLLGGNKPKRAFCECPVGACGLSAATQV